MKNDVLEKKKESSVGCERGSTYCSNRHWEPQCGSHFKSLTIASAAVQWWRYTSRCTSVIFAHILNLDISCCSAFLSSVPRHSFTAHLIVWNAGGTTCPVTFRSSRKILKKVTGSLPTCSYSQPLQRVGPRSHNRILFSEWSDAAEGRAWCHQGFQSRKSTFGPLPVHSDSRVSASCKLCPSWGAVSERNVRKNVLEGIFEGIKLRVIHLSVYLKPKLKSESLTHFLYF